MLGVTRPYLNLLVKPITFFQVFWKNIILCLLKGKMPFKMHKIMFFPEKKITKKIICVPTLPKIFRPVTLNTHFLFGLTICGIPITLSYLFKEHYDVRTVKHLIFQESNCVILKE